MTSVPDSHGRFGAFGGRYVPETLMAALNELEAAYAEARADAGLRGRAGRSAARLRRPADAALPRRATSRGASAAPRSTSSARTWRTPAPTRSTTPSARGCWPSAWASAASSPRPAPASTASPRRPSAPSSASSASSTWARWTWRARRPTSSACACSAPRCGPVTQRQPHPEGRDERGHARLGHERATTTYYLIGSAVGPHPYPAIVRDFQSVIGREAKQQLLGARGPPAGLRRRLRRRRQQRHRPVPRVHRRALGAADRRRSRRPRHRDR